jgi:eukaryotic-like serine/threonine-protein kinase
MNGRNPEDSTSWSDELESLVLKALEQPVDQRCGFIDAATDDPALRQEVLALLDSIESSDARLQALSDKLSSVTKSSAVPPIERAGPYRLERLLGRGGMSVVCLGIRDDGQFDQTVAVKLLPSGPVFDSLVRRFQAERQILAGLEHPGIARLLDGGVTENGLPYFVMEYVEGVPITEYCDRERLTIDQRLELLEQVFDVIQYAHRNLVVHRDLKPSNILVNAEGKVKLLDFGIAKLLDAPGQEGKATELTQLSGRPLTPAWTSPEQIAGRVVTTSSDVYSLGVLLYHLLVGCSPYQYLGGNAARLCEEVIEKEPLAPSERFVRPGNVPDEWSPRTVANRRSTGPRQLARRLRGDLDTIVQVAMRKEPERRYSTVEQFWADLKRHLAQLPIRARADRWTYRTRCFLARNSRTAAAITIVVAVALSGLYWHADRMGIERDKARVSAQIAEREAARAYQVSQYLVSLFEAADPNVSHGTEITAGELVDVGMARARQLEADPLLHAELLQVLAVVQRNLGEFENSRMLMEQALTTFHADPQVSPERLADALTEWGETLNRLGEFRAAEAAHREALSLVEYAFDPVLGKVLNNLGVVLNNLGEYSESESVHRRRLGLLEDRPSAGLNEATSRLNLGAVLYSQARFEEALDEFRQAQRIRGELLGPTHPMTSHATGNIAGTLMNLGQLDEAYEHYQRAIGEYRESLGSDHPELGNLLHMAGLAQWRMQQPEAAAQYWSEALELRTRVLPEGHAELGVSINAMAALARHRGDLDEAEALVRRSLANVQATHGERHYFAADILSNLGTLHMDRARFDRAREKYETSCAIYLENFDDTHPLFGRCKFYLGRMYSRMGDQEAALAYVEQAHGILLNAHSPEHHSVQEVVELLQEIRDGPDSGAGAE